MKQSCYIIHVFRHARWLNEISGPYPNEDEASTDAEMIRDRDEVQAAVIQHIQRYWVKSDK